eukprot:CAMPEP_0180537048 /NCGR_PEP_ID=MMETSP1036_2-20121128/65605_1 /TAXON_ID=632150 /ORGANISM="Azadinium spinosum, Strain 3D9" /LENGTH=44 /DNA_ID= /DNA_START= /DNA_END= /DNA_ORIENTATION=
MSSSTTSESRISTVPVKSRCSARGMPVSNSMAFFTSAPGQERSA